MPKKTFLILSFFLFASCSAFPTKYRWVIDVYGNKCTRWEIDPHTLNSIAGSATDFPLLKCNGFVATSAEDYPKEKQWVKDNCSIKLERNYQ